MSHTQVFVVCKLSNLLSLAHELCEARTPSTFYHTKTTKLQFHATVDKQMHRQNNLELQIILVTNPSCFTSLVFSAGEVSSIRAIGVLPPEAVGDDGAVEPQVAGVRSTWQHQMLVMMLEIKVAKHPHTYVRLWTWL